MHEIQKTLKEGIIMGIEHAENLFSQFPFDTAMGALNDYKMRLMAELKPEETSERIQEEV